MQQVPGTASPSLALLPTSDADIPLASELALQLELPVLSIGTDPQLCVDHDILLVVSGGLLALQQTPHMAPSLTVGRRRKSGQRSQTQVLPGPVMVDFGSEAMRHRRRSGHNELLGRAVGISKKRRPNVLDATAGLGRDSFVLADMGCVVMLCEREPILAAMLSQGLQVALIEGDDWLRQVAGRMSLFTGDARTLVTSGAPVADVIYLDPMFPQREKSAAVKKEMVLFQSLLRGGATALDADELLLWALSRDVSRVVVKRPSRAPFLAGQKPSHCVEGKSVRFDVHVRRALA